MTGRLVLVLVCVAWVLFVVVAVFIVALCQSARKKCPQHWRPSRESNCTQCEEEGRELPAVKNSLPLP